MTYATLNGAVVGGAPMLHFEAGVHSNGVMPMSPSMAALSTSASGRRGADGGGGASRGGCKGLAATEAAPCFGTVCRGGNGGGATCRGGCKGLAATEAAPCFAAAAGFSSGTSLIVQVPRFG